MYYKLTAEADCQRILKMVAISQVLTRAEQHHICLRVKS